MGLFSGLFRGRDDPSRSGRMIRAELSGGLLTSISSNRAMWRRCAYWREKPNKSQAFEIIGTK
jgi:hypothetical protein